MELELHLSDFVNDKYTVTYNHGTREALFTIVDEHFEGNSGIGRVNKINIMVRGIKADGTPDPAVLVSSVIGDVGRIGMGDNTVGIRTTDDTLMGLVLNKDNMDRCQITLYEDE